ncbi:MAG: hypothetical protein MJ231_05080 [bacterium]|nr:hypothetical protein [bacterium]
MIKYAKITDASKGVCDVGLGTNLEFYKSIGMTELDVEQGYDGVWYLKEYLETEGYKNKLAQFKQNDFKSKFFETSLGWIKRKVNMKDGATKDFLCDILPQIKMAVELGENVQLITYKTPDFTKDCTEEYLKSIQERKSADLNFIKECLLQTSADFYG